jgi:glutamine amidotransferase
MCRIAAYHGPVCPLSCLTTDYPHGLLDQALHARELPGFTMCPDGWKLGWLAPGDAPAILTGTKPIYMDENALSLPPHIRSGAQVGVARLASPTTMIADASNPLYQANGMLFAFNGEIKGWPAQRHRVLDLILDRTIANDIKDSTEPEHIVALWRELLTCRYRHEVSTSDPAVAALGHTLDLLGSKVDEAAFNILVVRPGGIIAARWAKGKPHNSLYSLTERGALFVASEPFDPDDSRWIPVPEQAITVSLNHVGRVTLTHHPI